MHVGVRARLHNGGTGTVSSINNSGGPPAPYTRHSSGTAPTSTTQETASLGAENPVCDLETRSGGLPWDDVRKDHGVTVGATLAASALHAHRWCTLGLVVVDADAPACAPGPHEAHDAANTLQKTTGFAFSR
jgi:hypothetical protein